MPYASISELPPAVRDRYSQRCQEVFRKTFNAWDGDEAAKFKVAHTAAGNCKSSGKRYTMADIESATNDLIDNGVAVAKSYMDGLIGSLPSERSPLVDMTVKFAEGSDTIIEGYGVPFGDDLDGQRFTPDTERHHDWFPKGGRPILYHHGFNDAIKMTPVGWEQSTELREEGDWVRAELDKASKYYDRVAKLVRDGKVGWSSAAPDHKVKVAQDGTIQVWPVIEYSLTPTPSKPNQVAFAMKSEQASEVLESAKAEIPDPLADIEQTTDDAVSESLAEQSEQVLAGLKAWSGRMEARADARIKVGRELSKANIEALRQAYQTIGALLERADKPSEDEADAAKAALELQLALTE